MNRTSVLPLVNKARLTKHLIKNYWRILLILGVAIGATIPFVLSSVQLRALFEFPFLEHVRLLKAVVILFACKAFFLPKKPGYLLNHATLFHFYHHRRLKGFFNLLYLKKALFLLVAAGIMSYVISNLSFGADYGVLVFVLWLFFFSVSLLGWGKYNADKRTGGFLIGAFLVNGALFFFLSAWYILPGLLVVILAAAGLNHHGFSLNYVRFMDYLRQIDEANAAASKADYERMALVLTRARAGAKRSIYLPIFPISVGNVFIQKTLIRLLGEPKAVWVIGFLPYTVLLVLGATVGGAFSSGYLLALSLQMAASVLNQFFVKDFNGLIAKRTAGLSLPYTNRRLLLLCLPAPALGFAISSAFIGANLLAPLWKIGLHYLVALGSFIGLGAYTLKKGYTPKVLSVLQNLAIALATLGLL